MTGIPAVVAQAIADTTGTHPRLGRRARAGACGTCRAAVVRGLDEDMCAFLAEADPSRVTPLGELQAILTGRSTYTLDGSPPQLMRRDQYRISSRPADQVVVLAEHRCGALPLPAFPDMPRPVARRKATTDEPPF